MILHLHLGVCTDSSDFPLSLPLHDLFCPLLQRIMQLSGTGFQGFGITSWRGGWEIPLHQQNFTHTLLDPAFYQKTENIQNLFHKCQSLVARERIRSQNAIYSVHVRQGNMVQIPPFITARQSPSRIYWNVANIIDQLCYS